MKVLRLPAKTKVRFFAQRVKRLARCHLEKRGKSIPKSTQNRGKSRVASSGMVHPTPGGTHGEGLSGISGWDEPERPSGGYNRRQFRTWNPPGKFGPCKLPQATSVNSLIDISMHTYFYIHIYIYIHIHIYIYIYTTRTHTQTHMHACIFA